MQRSLYAGLVSAFLVTASPFLHGCAGNGETGHGEIGTGTDLLTVVAISRHGIRSQTPALETINLFTLRPQGFPLWAAPANIPGNLSAAGLGNVVRLGAWYRDFYAAQGLLPQRGSCPAAGTVFVYADVMERTIDTAHGYLDGLFQNEATPDCGVQVLHSSGQADPYIDPPQAGICKIESDGDQAAFSDETGGDPAALATTFAAQLQTLQTVTQCCKPSACATTGNPNPASCSLRDLPSQVSVDATTGAVGFGPLFSVADLTTETLLLEYAEGMPETDCATTEGAECVGWGAIPSGGLYDLMKLHVMHFDLLYRLPSVAQAASSNLMRQLVGTMDQAVSGVKNPDILAPAESKFSLFVGHDVNLTAIGGFLGVTWKAEGFQKNDPGPAGALVFELHRVRQSGDLIVRLFFVSATLDQMRNRAEITLGAPPQRIPLTIAACGELDCPYELLKTFVSEHVRSDCLTTAASGP